MIQHTETQMIATILAAPDAALAACAPRVCSMTTYEIAISDDRYIASVVQHTFTDAGEETDLLHVRRFGTRRNAEGWLNARRVG